MIPTVQIFLSTYNGEKYLREQLNSLLVQENVKIHILVRDDGSTDNTINILKEYHANNKLDYYFGNNLGYAKSFLHLLSNNVNADYYAFCDQDDIWLPNKLIKAINQINTETIPCLYASSLQRVDENLNYLNLQSFKNLQLNLGAEFTRHRLAGCTFVFNKKLYDIIKNAYYIKNLNTSHDKLITILCLACRGKVLFDKNSYILFRRYGTNTSIDGKNLIKKIFNEFNHFTTYRHVESNLAKQVLDNYSSEIDSKSYILLKKITDYRYNMIDYIKLILSKDIDCGFWFYNLFIRFIIICRYF